MALDMYNKPVPVTFQCLAIVLCKSDGRELTQTGSGSHSARSSRDGQKLFQELQNENRESFWNPALVESVSSLELVGFMRPGTLLVSGSELHLECLRGAWARRVLKPPRGYSIKSLGDIGGIEMQAVPQTQFIPLPEVLCLLISSLNKSGQPATIDTVTTALQDQYAGITLPRPEVVYAALAALVTEGKVYCMGDHYFLSTPLMYQQYQAAFMQRPVGGHLWQNEQYPLANWALQTRHASKHQEMCSRECQTGASIVNGIPPYKPSGNRKDQAASAQENKTTPDLNQEHMVRGHSLKENKNSDGKEKQGFFSWLFRGSRSREGKGRTRKEDQMSEKPVTNGGQSAPLATFSAQFPPPEWMPDPRQLRASNQQGQHFFRSRRSKEKTALKPNRHSIWVDLEPSWKGSSRRTNRNDVTRITSKKYGTVPENLAGNIGGQFSPKIERARTSQNKHRLSKYLSSSSECLHYLGPTNLILEENLENKNDRHSGVRMRRPAHRYNNPPSQVVETQNLDKLPNSEAYRAMVSKRQSAEERRKKTSEILAPLAVPTDVSGDATDLTGDRTSTALIPEEEQTRTKQNSDSALSSSPVVTEMSSTSGDSNKYSSWSESETLHKPEPPLDHTYVNLRESEQKLPLPSPVMPLDRTYENIKNGHLESTQFENITEDDLEELVEENEDVSENGNTQVTTKTVRLSPKLEQTKDNNKNCAVKQTAAAYISAV